MANIRLALNRKALKVGDLVKFEQGATTMLFMRDFLARFVVDDKDKPVKFADAQLLIDDLDIDEMTAAVTSLTENLGDDFVPPVSGNS